MIKDGTVVNADISASAAIGLSKLATGALPSGITVASSNIVDGTIVNADINNSAAIALSKLATGALPTAITVASANIVDGTIVNADVNASAAIAGTKISPNFGSQNVLTTGTATAASLIPTGSSVPTNGVYLPAANSVGISTNGTGRVTVDSSGRLLVGTSTGTGNLRVQENFALVTTGSGNIGGMAITNYGGTGPGARPLLDFQRSRGTTDGSFTAVASNDQLGSIIFGGADGSQFVNGAIINCEVDGTPGVNDMPGRLVFSTTADGASSPTERLRINSSGDVTTNPNFSFISTGTADGFTINKANNSLLLSRDDGIPFLVRRRTSNGTMVEFRRDTTLVGTISVTTTNTAYNTSSDYRLKENVVPLSGAIDRLQQIPVHRFNFIADPDTVVDGFIAHEAQEIVPECVTGAKDEVDEDGNPVYQGIDQSKIVPLLTAALQEAIGRIETLEAKVAALEAS
jgi:hypothetical protein